MYFIGTKGKTVDYVNPHKLQQSGAGAGMVASMSSTGKGSPYRFLNHSAREENETYNTDGSWMKLDIGFDRSMVVNYYCLRDGSICGFKILPNWVLQDSHSGGDTLKEWCNLSVHTYDSKLRSTEWPNGPSKRPVCRKLDIDFSASCKLGSILVGNTYAVQGLRFMASKASRNFHVNAMFIDILPMFVS